MICHYLRFFLIKNVQKFLFYEYINPEINSVLDIIDNKNINHCQYVETNKKIVYIFRNIYVYLKIICNFHKL